MGKFINFVKYEELFQTLKNLSERGFVWSDRVLLKQSQM